MAHQWDRGVLSKSSWHGLEEIGVFLDADGQIGHGEKSGAWPIKLESEGLVTATGIKATGWMGQVAYYSEHPTRVVGINGNKYRATTPDEWRSLVRAACEAGAKPTGAFSLRDGSRCLGTFEVGEGNGLRTQFLLCDSYDGSMPLTTGWTSIRVVCANTLSAAMKSDGSEMARLRHTASLEEKVKKLKESITEAVKSGDSVRKAFKRAVDVKLNREQAHKAFDLLFPPAPEGASKNLKTRADNNRTEAMKAAALPVNRVGTESGNLGTLWNAATYLVDRNADGSFRKTKGGDALDSLLFGTRGKRLEEVRQTIENIMEDGSIMLTETVGKTSYSLEDILND